MTNPPTPDAEASSGPEREPGVGDRLGPYRIVESMPDPSRGLRFRGLDTRSGRERLLEWFPPSAGIDEARFDRETELLAGLRHPNFLTVLGSGRAAGGHYVVFEESSGTPILEWIARDRPDHRTVAGMFSALARAIAYLRSRGLFPAGIEADRVLVELDGTARFVRYPGLGPPSTSAEEDMAAIGGTLDRALGRISGETPSGLRDIVRRCLHPHTDDAYLALTELASDLNGWHTARIGPGGNETTRVLLFRVRRRRRARAAGIALSGAGLLAAAIYVVAGQVDRAPPPTPVVPEPEAPAADPGASDERTETRRVRDALARAEEIESADGPAAALAFLDDQIARRGLPADSLAPRRVRLRWTVLETQAVDAIDAGRYEEALRGLEATPPLGLVEYDSERNRLAVLCRVALALSANDARAFAESVNRFVRAGGGLDLIFRTLTTMLRGGPEPLRATLRAVEPATIQVLSRALLQLGEEPRHDEVVAGWIECLGSVGDPRWTGALVRLLARRPEPLRSVAAGALADLAGGQPDRIAAALAPLAESEKQTARLWIARSATAAVAEGRAAFQRQDPAEALRLARRAAVLTPTDPSPLLLLTDLRLASGQTRDALESLLAARSLRAAEEAIAWRLGRIHRLDGRLDEAGRILEEAATAHPGSGEIALERGVLRYHQRRFNESDQELERAYGRLVEGRRVLELAACRTWQARSRIQLGAAAEAIRLAAEAAALDPASAHAQAVLALASLESGDAEGADEAARASLSMAVTDVGLVVRGRLALARSAPREALPDLVRALELATVDRPEICRAAARAHVALGEPRTALEYLERARREAPGLPGIDQELAEARARLAGGE